jgi:hypothetical protein
MCKLLKKDEEFKWIETCNTSWEWMKTSMMCLPVSMVPNWKIEFHVHTNTSNFVLGVMLGPNPNYTIDRPIYYASKLMNNAKNNYTTTEKEILTMIYAMKKFRRYLLGNIFIFFVYH